MCWLGFSCRLFCYCQGKFWKNFGHNEDGKQWLYPEEALFLMDEVSNALVTKILPLFLNTDLYTFYSTTSILYLVRGLMG